MLEIRLFGRFELKIDGLKVASSSRKTTALIAYLALEGATPRSELAHQLWTDSTEEAARRSLRQELWQIQKTALGQELHLEGEHVGLSNAVELDVQLFPALLETGDLTAALDLYRGVLLEGFKISGASAFEEWLEVKREFFAGLRRNALAKQAENLEAVGDLRGALTAHVELLNENPLLEAHQRDAIRLLAMLGEPALALERFEGFKQLLQDELSLEPLAETVRLANRVRASEILEPNLKSKAFQVGDALTSPLVGRDVAWKLLEQPRAGLTVVVGAPGVGKTRLVEEFARTKNTSLWFYASEVALETPLYPVAQALRFALENPATRLKLDQLDQVWKTEVSRLIPELGAGTNSSAFESPSANGRARFLEGLSRAILAISEANSLIVFDDLHWADSSSLELFAHLIERGRTNLETPRCIASARELELEENTAVQTLLKNLKRQDQLQHIKLEKLGEADVQAMVQSMSGSSSASLFSKRLCQATAGNPLYLMQTIRHLFEIGTLFANEHGWNTAFDETTSDYAELSIPASVFEAVLERVAHVGGEAKRVLEAASLAEDGFGLETLLGATALSEWQGLEALERLTATNLLVPHGDGYGFPHDLVRRALEESLSSERKRILHKRLASTLERNQAAPEAIARHFEMAAKPADAAPWRVKAAKAAERLYAWDEALEHYQQALLDGVTDRVAVEVLQARIILWARLTKPLEQEAELNAVDTLVARMADPTLIAEVDLARANFLNHIGRSKESLDIADRALKHDLTPNLTSRAHAIAGSALRRLGRMKDAESRLLLALPGAEGVWLGNTHSLLALCAMLRHDSSASKFHNQAGLAAYERAGDQIGICTALQYAGILAKEQGQSAEAVQFEERALEIARAHGDARHMTSILGRLAYALLDLGRVDTAQKFLEEGLSLVQNANLHTQFQNLYHYLGLVQSFKGGLGHAMTSLRTAIESFDKIEEVEGQVTTRVGLAALLVLARDFGNARRLLEEAQTLFEQVDIESCFWRVQLGFADLEFAESQPLEVLERLGRSSLLKYPQTSDELLEIDVLTIKAKLALGMALDFCTAPTVQTTPQLQVAFINVQLQIATARRVVRTDDLETARHLLQSGRIAMPDMLELQRALADVLESTAPHEARAFRDQANRCALEMAQTLPFELQAGFLANYGLETTRLEFVQNAL